MKTLAKYHVCNHCVIGEKTFKNILIGPGKLPGLSRNGHLDSTGTQIVQVERIGMNRKLGKLVPKYGLVIGVLIITIAISSNVIGSQTALFCTNYPAKL